MNYRFFHYTKRMKFKPNVYLTRFSIPDQLQHISKSKEINVDKKNVPFSAGMILICRNIFSLKLNFAYELFFVRDCNFHHKFI